MDLEAAIKSHHGNAVEPEVEPLKYAHLPRLIDTFEVVKASDPVYLYTTVGTTDRFFRLRSRWQSGIELANAVRKNTMFTIGSGEAFVIYRPAGKPPAEKGMNKILNAITLLAIRALRGHSEEIEKRSAEFEDKMSAAAQEAFGDSLVDMIRLVKLGTHPVKQRRGYGTALVKFITDLADVQGRSTWLVSSNVDNTGFYESCGFCTVSEFTLGDTNPTWRELPIVVRIMLRKPAVPMNKKL